MIRFLKKCLLQPILETPVARTEMVVQRWNASVELSVLTCLPLVWGQCVDPVKLDLLEMGSNALVRATHAHTDS